MANYEGTPVLKAGDTVVFRERYHGAEVRDNVFKYAGRIAVVTDVFKAQTHSAIDPCDYGIRVAFLDGGQIETMHAAWCDKFPNFSDPEQIEEFLHE